MFHENFFPQVFLPSILALFGAVCVVVFSFQLIDSYQELSQINKQVSVAHELGMENWGIENSKGQIVDDKLVTKTKQLISTCWFNFLFFGVAFLVAGVLGRNHYLQQGRRWGW